MTPPDRRSHVLARGLATAGALSLVAFSACVTCTPRDESLRERPDHSTPELAFETFRAAVRCDDGIAGYRALSEAFKEREGVTLTTALIWWDQVFKANPIARLAGNAEIESAAPRGRDRCTLVVGAYGKRRVVELVAQTYYEVRVRGRREPIDGFVPRLAAHVESTGDAVAVTLRDPRLAGVPLGDIDSVTLATEWKILDFREPPESPAP